MRLTIKGFNYGEPKADKLSQLEDTEEELGIDLATLFKALEQGAWFVDKRNKNIFFAKCTLCSKLDGKFECTQEEMKFNGFIILEQLFGLGYELKDYGKTWALTKEELETQIMNNCLIEYFGLEDKVERHDCVNCPFKIHKNCYEK